MDNTGRYRAYLLRMWSVEQSGQVVWRASLEDPQTGELFGFADLTLLFDFLMDRALGIGSAGKSGGCHSSPDRYGEGVE
jgi:hypothetical protein